MRRWIEWDMYSRPPVKMADIIETKDGFEYRLVDEERNNRETESLINEGMKLHKLAIADAIMYASSQYTFVDIRKA